MKNKSKSLLILAILGLSSAVQAQTTPLISAVINLKARVSMDSLAESVMNRSSSRYHRFYSPDEIRDISAPSLDEYKALVTQLQTAGLTVTRSSRTGMHISVRGPADVFEKLFNVQFQYYHNDPRIHKIASLPTIPSDLPLIDSVTGMNNYVKRRPKYSVESGPAASGFTSAPKGYLPAQIHSLYGLDALYASGLTGKGQHIAIATYDGFNLTDVQTYFKQMNLPSPSIDVKQFNGNATVNPESAIETEVDAEFSGMIAPGAMIHVYTSAENDEAGELAMFTAILDDNQAKIINYSWGQCEPSIDPQHRADMDKVFARAVAQGVNIQVASGDSGSNDCDQVPNAPQGPATDFPSSSPSVVAVGGTTITSVVKGLPMQSGWSGSGGGYANPADYPRPSWQANIGGSGGRGVPDVSFNADPKSGEPAWVTNPDTGQTAYLQIGGTSIAAPQWSGFMALVGEARNGSPVGLITPLIYALSNQQRASLFMDVTTGSNGAYSAAVGWDAVTGFGPMRAPGLLQFLVSQK